MIFLHRNVTRCCCCSSLHRKYN